MLTLIEKLQRQMKRYNRRRGSAMLMVLMTMAIIIVVGTSMLYITLSSFSTSIADTNQTKAYNAATTVAENVKNNKAAILDAYEPTDSTPVVTLKFQNDASFTEADPYTLINGVKVSVTLSKTETTTAQGVTKTILVDVVGTYHSEVSQVSFTLDRTETYPNTQLENTYGNAFVINSSLGGEAKTESLTFRRIEGDISINCYEDVYDTSGNPVMVDGVVQQKMVTRYFNPVVLEGVTGSIFANGDLVIGSYDNVIKVQGNIYCDGNLTIRGLNLGANLPALYKTSYKEKYMKYTTIGHTTIAGFEVLSSAEKIDRLKGGRIGEAMYKKIGDKYIPLQVYDEVSHYTLLDLFMEDSDNGLFTFWTMNYENSDDGIAEQVTIDLNKLPDDVVNKKYYGATMWYDEKCTDPILQYPDGGNVYCTGDIIFDKANYGYVWVYSADNKEYQYKDLSYSDTEPAINQSYIDGDIFCLGRMIIAPDNLSLIEKGSGENKDALVAFTTAGGYLNKTTLLQQSSATGSNVLGTIKSLFGISGGGTWTMNLNVDVNGNPVLYTKDYSNGYRYYQNTYGESSLTTEDGYATKAIVKEVLCSFISSLSNHNSAGYTTLKNKFIAVVNGGVSSLLNTSYVYAGNGYIPDKGVYRSVKFNENSDFYIYNWQYSGITEAGVEIARKLNTSSVVTDAKTKAGCANILTTTVNGLTYDSALTIKLSNISINSVYANGSINVIGIDNAFGYDYDAKLSANTISSTADISSDYKQLSLVDIVRYVYKLDSTEKAIEKIKTDYFGFSDTSSLYNGSGDVTYKINDGEQINKNQINSVIVLSYYANYYIDIQYTRTSETGINKHDFDATWKITDGTSPTLSYEASKRYWEYCYCNGSFYKFDGQTGNPVDDSEIQLAFDITNAELTVWKTKFATSIFKYSDNVFLDYISNESFIKQIEADFKIQKEKLLALDSIKTPTTKTTIINYFDNKVNGKNLRDNDYYNLRKGVNDTPYSYRSIVRADLKTKETTDYDRFDIALGFDDVKDYIVNDFSEQLNMLGLVSSAKNSLNAIVSGYGLTVDSNFNRDYSMFNVTDYTSKDAFSGKYGMYLRTSLVDANPDVNSRAKVSDIFNEMLDEKFALVTVQQTTQLTEPILRELIEKGEDTSVQNIQEYDTFSFVSNDENPLYKVGEDSIYNPILYNETENNLFTLKGYVGALEWVEKIINDVWFYTKTKSSTFSEMYYAIHNKSGKDNNVKVMKFTNSATNYNTLNANSNFKVVNNIGIDPLYITYDEDGKPLSGSTASKAFWSMTTIRTQVDYTITGNVYFNFGGENGGYDTEVSSPVEFGASSQSGTDIIDTINNSKRMNITVDTTQAGYNTKTGKNNDIYIYINAPCISYTNVGAEKGDYNIVGYTAVASGKGNYTKDSKNNYSDVGVGNGDYVGVFEYVGSGNGEYTKDAGIIFNKCSWRVKGTGNVYIMLVGDTSINANAYSLSINWGGGVFNDQADRTDAMLGTHFYSATYTNYVTKYIGHTENKDAEYREIVAEAVSVEDAGELFIIGTGDNQMVVGRGGYINGFVYLPNGSYVNRSKGFLGIIPNATSAYNQATIVAEHIAIESSNIGNLIFQSLDVKAMGNSGSADTTISFVDTNNDTKVIKWEFGTYYYN